MKTPIPCKCGALYTPSSDGVRQHRSLHNHTPSPEVPTPPVDLDAAVREAARKAREK